MALLELRDVSLFYARASAFKPILQNINFKINQGDFLAIQGPSGSGKSTLFYILGCLLKPTSGEVLVDGRNVNELSDLGLATLRNTKIGFVFQQFHLLPKANVLENILLPSIYPMEDSSTREEDKKRALELAQSLGIGDHLYHLPNQLSGGQQQRVAIARALLRSPDIILADEPTGNLDSKTSSQIMDLFSELHAQGKTILLITHDHNVAKRCGHVMHLIEGRFSQNSTMNNVVPETNERQLMKTPSPNDAHLNRWIQWSQQIKSLLTSKTLSLAIKIAPVVFQNLRVNSLRSILTMLGITMGVAAMVSMITIGQFTKKKVLDSYAELGVNTFLFRGYTNWNLKATDAITTPFRSFDWDRDIKPLKRIFPEIQSLSPNMTIWSPKIFFGGRTIDNDIRIVGMGAEGLSIANRHLILGHGFTPFQVERKSGVCVIGFEIFQKLFTTVYPIGQIISIKNNNNSFTCRVIGVLKSKTSNNEWSKPNLHLILPFTYFQNVASHFWEAQISDLMISTHSGEDVIKTGQAVKSFFVKKYGISGEFSVDSDSVLVSQMQRFLTLFTILLGLIAAVALAVGAVGITNMMLVSVSERIKEIGLRKALGATDFSIRVQFLTESMITCLMAGVIGIALGVVVYEVVIFAATHFVSKLTFEWIFDIWAILISFLAIVLVGILSGMVPALRAEKLQVIEALRNE